MLASRFTLFFSFSLSLELRALIYDTLSFLLWTSHSCPITPGGAFCRTVCGGRKEGILDSIIEARNTEICLYEYVERAFCASGVGVLIFSAIESHIGVDFCFWKLWVMHSMNKYHNFRKKQTKASFVVFSTFLNTRHFPVSNYSFIGACCGFIFLPLFCIVLGVDIPA